MSESDLGNVTAKNMNMNMNMNRMNMNMINVVL